MFFWRCDSGGPDETDRAVGDLVGVRPDAVAVRGIDRDDAGAGFDQVHDPVVDEWSRLLHSRRKSQRPGQRESGDVVAVDLVEWTEALLIVGAVDHEPIRRIGILQHLVGDGLEVADLAERRRRGRPNGDDDQSRDRAHDLPLASYSSGADSTRWPRCRVCIVRGLAAPPLRSAAGRPPAMGTHARGKRAAERCGYCLSFNQSE